MPGFSTTRATTRVAPTSVVAADRDRMMVAAVIVAPTSVVEASRLRILVISATDSILDGNYMPT